MEFAVIAPVLIIIMMGGYDASTALITWRRTNAAAQEIVKIVTEQSVQADQTTSLTPYQLFQAETAVYAISPNLFTGTVPVTVITSGVVFTPSPANCVPGVNCTYTANTAWSVPLSYGTQARRSCGTLAQVTAGSAPSLTSIPTAGITAPTSMVVVDVSQVFKPLFAGFLGPTFAQGFTFSSSAMLLPRVGTPSQYVEYNISGGQAGTDPNVCPGYL